MLPVGPLTNPEGVFILGSGPGREDLKAQEPLSGLTGKEMDEVLMEAGLHRSKLLVANAYACHAPEPRRDADERAAINACRPLLQHYLKNIPKDTPTLLAGKWALLAVTGDEDGLMATRGFRDDKWSVADALKKE